MALLPEGLFVITEEVVKAAAVNKGDGEGIMTLIFEKRGADISITEEVVKVVAKGLAAGS